MCLLLKYNTSIPELSNSPYRIFMNLVQFTNYFESSSYMTQYYLESDEEYEYLSFILIRFPSNTCYYINEEDFESIDLISYIYDNDCEILFSMITDNLNNGEIRIYPRSYNDSNTIIHLPRCDIPKIVEFINKDNKNFQMRLIKEKDTLIFIIRK